MHPSGTIVIPLLRTVAPEFMMSLQALEVPDETYYLTYKSMDVTSSLNAAFREVQGEWVWCQADDHHFPPDTLTRLLDRDVDVIVPLMAQKSPPFNLVVYKGEESVVWNDGREYPSYTRFAIDEIPGTGIFPVHAAGSGSMLIRKHVLDDVGDPWFHNPHATVVNDDLEFCRKVREAGYTIYADADVSVGHIGQFTAYPVFDSQSSRWGMTFDFGGPGTNRIWLTREAIMAFEAAHRNGDD